MKTENTVPTVSQLRAISERKRAALTRAEAAQAAAEAGQREAAAAQRELGFNNVRARNAREAAERALNRRVAITRRAALAYESALAALNAAEARAAEAAPAKLNATDAELAAAVSRAFDRLSADVDAVNARTFAAHVANPFTPGTLAAAVIADAAVSGKLERAAADLESAEAAAAEARANGTPRASAAARRRAASRCAALTNAWNAAAEAGERAAAAVIAANAGDVGALAALDAAAWENEAAAARAGLFSGAVAEARTRGRCAVARRIALAIREALNFARTLAAADVSAELADDARNYLAARRADCGVFPALRAFGASLDAAGLKTLGNADAEARAILRVRFDRCAAIYDAAHARGGCPDWIALTLRDKNTAGAAWHAYAAPDAL